MYPVKKKMVSLVIVSVLCMTFMLPVVQSAQGATVTLEVLNPKGNVELLPLQPLAERVNTLEGKKIYLYFYSKDTGTPDVRGPIGTLLTERFGTYNANTNPTGVTVITTLNKSGVDYHDTVANYDTMARQCDVAVLGVAN